LNPMLDVEITKKQKEIKKLLYLEPKCFLRERMCR